MMLYPRRFNRITPTTGLLGALFCLALSTGFAQTAVPDTLSPYEHMLFSHSYAGESLTDRLSRLETSVFGETQTGTESQRQTRLIQALGAAKKAVPSVSSGSSTNASPGAGISSFTSPASNGYGGSPPSGNPMAGNYHMAPASPPQRPDATDYPTVTALEREVFGRDFIHEDVSHRLSRMEKKVFGQSYPQTAMIDRVDKLLERYPNVSTAHTTTVDTAASPAIRDLPSDSSQFVGSSRDIYTKVDELERKFFNGNTTPNALLTERLDRLEMHAYGRRYSGHSVDSRVNRLIMAYQVKDPGAQARQPIQSRQLYQPSPGSMQQFNNPSSNSYTATYPAPGYAPPAMGPAPQIIQPSQNIQIGGGFSQSSNSQFSPEMMSMLPPEVQNQLSGTSRSNSSSGTVIGAPSTVIIERTHTNNGFQTYGGQPIQHYNYYSSPGTTTQSQSTTTVIQPNGGTAVYSYPGASNFPGNPNGLPNPAYVGDPAFLQSLNNLEINVYGQVNTVEPAYVRLGKLETTLLGQMYVGYPEDQRLANLQKTYQLQAVGKLLGKSKAANMGRTAGSALLGLPITTPNPMNVPPMPTTPRP
jgi:hypothetical protein